jgi:hypothetical protein
MNSSSCLGVRLPSAMLIGRSTLNLVQSLTSFLNGLLGREIKEIRLSTAVCSG